ncbi:transposase [Natrinema mahii]|nr:transposase [Natrinema mahii]
MSTDRPRLSTSGVQKADLQPAAETNPNHVALDEAVIQIGAHQYWLAAAVGPETNKVLHTRLSSTTTTALTERFLWERLENHDVEVTVFLVDGAQHLQATLHRHGPKFRYEKRESEEYQAYLLREKTTYLFILKLI